MCNRQRYRLNTSFYSVCDSTRCRLDDQLRVKVADFGLSRDLIGFSGSVYESSRGSARLPVKWMAPESIRSGQYSSKSDVVCAFYGYASTS